MIPHFVGMEFAYIEIDATYVWTHDLTSAIVVRSDAWVQVYEPTDPEGELSPDQCLDRFFDRPVPGRARAGTPRSPLASR